MENRLSSLGMGNCDYLIRVKDFGKNLKPGVMSGKWKKQEMLNAKESYSTFLPMG
jgi:hypothetical protein